MKKPPTPPEKICRQMSRKYFQSNPPDLKKKKEKKRGVGGYKQIIYISTKANTPLGSIYRLCIKR